MKIDNLKVVGYDSVTGNVTLEDGSFRYLNAGLNITLDDYNDSIKESGLEYAKAGYSSEDLMRLKACGVI